MTRLNPNSRVKFFAGVDRVGVLLYVLLTLVGLVAIFSASWDGNHDTIYSFSNSYMKQAMWLGIAWVVALVVLLLDGSVWHKTAYFLYGAGIGVLCITLLFGREVNGAKAWFDFGGVRVQPMEFVKIAIALAVARVMSGFSFSIAQMSNVVKVALVLMLPIGIAVLQNDTGSGIVLGSFLFMLYREGLNKWICIPILFIAMLFILSFILSSTTLLVALIVVFTLSEALNDRRWLDCIRYVAGLALVSLLLLLVANIVRPGSLDFYWALLISTMLSLPVVLWYAYRQRLRNIYLSVAIFAASIMLLPTSDALFNALRPHQQNRIMSFLGVSSDFNIDFNVNQSKIAIGSGGFTGKGFLKGSQIRYNFVPEKHTDFIFCTIGEEWGFVGAILVLALIAALIYRLMWLGDRQSEAFGRVYCYCVASMLLFHTLVNVGMTIGVIPVMGIPLPLISYGGSSLVAFTVMIFIAFALDASSNHDDMSRSGSRWR